MAHRSNTLNYTTTIFLGMFGLFAADVLLSGHVQLVGIFLGSAVILVSLITKLTANHEALMQSTAPGACLYQHLIAASQLPARYQRKTSGMVLSGSRPHHLS